MMGYQPPHDLDMSMRPSRTLLFLAFLALSFLASAGVYFLFAYAGTSVNSYGNIDPAYIFGVLFRMHMYHYKHPYQYIALFVSAMPL
jgi:hypothetical protein